MSSPKRRRTDPTVHRDAFGEADFHGIVPLLFSSGTLHIGRDMLRLGTASSSCHVAHWPLWGVGSLEDVELSQYFVVCLVERLQAAARASRDTPARSASCEQDSKVEERAHRAAMIIISCLNSHNQKRLADAGVVPALGALAARSGSMTQASSAWALAKLCDRLSNNDFDSYYVPGAVGLAIQLLSEKSLDVQGKGALFVAGYAENVDDFAVDVVLAGAVPHLEQLLHEGSYPHKHEALEAVSSLTVYCGSLECNHADQSVAFSKVSSAFPYVFTLLRHDNAEMRERASNALVNIVQADTDDHKYVGMAVRAGCIEAVMEMSASSEIDDQKLLLSLESMLRGSPLATSVAMRHGLVTTIVWFLSKRRRMCDFFVDLIVGILSTVIQNLRCARSELTDARVDVLLRRRIRQFTYTEGVEARAELLFPRR